MGEGLADSTVTFLAPRAGVQSSLEARVGDVVSTNDFFDLTYER